LSGKSLLLGIDLGTTLIKAVVFDENGNQVASNSQEVSVEYPKPGWAEQDPEALWDVTCRVVRECLSRNKIDPASISGISLTGQMHGSFLIDREGKPARKKAIIWLDTRSQEILEEYYRTSLADRIYDVSGWRLITSMQVMHLSWLLRNEPETIKKAKCLMACKDYIRYKLTGEPYMDITDASVTGLMDISKGKWSSELVSELGIPEEILPEIKNSWEYAGEVTEEAAKRTGLKPGIPVAAGAGDICSTALGSGVVRPGQLCAIIGTAGIYELAADKPLKDPERKYSVAFHAIPNSWLLEAVQMTAGVALRWFRDEFCEAEKMEAREKGVSVYAIMDREAEGSPIGANGVIFHPFLQGERSPFVKPSARGVFYGLGLWTKRADLIRAVLEGVAYAARDNIELFRGRGIEIREVRITGGGAASDIWCRIMSDVLNLKITVPVVKECGALGSAIEASIVAGINRDPVEAAERMVRIERTFTPNQQNVEKYQKLFQLYKKLYELLWNYYDEAWKTYSSL